MRYSFLLLLALGFSACKNNGNGTASAPKEQTKATPPAPALKEIIVDAAKTSAVPKPDFTVLSWDAKGEVLELIVRYSGGCKEHDFNAYFSGGWLKSFPPQAMVALEHVNPDKDPCRSLVTDTLQFSLKNVRYAGGKEVVVKWSGDVEKWTKYTYGE